MTKKILLIDGNSLIYRAYFANSYRSQTILRTSDGIPTNAVYSFINMLLSLLAKENYDEVKVAFDAGKKTFRHQKMPTYKAKRHETPQELLTQLPIVRDFLNKIGIQWFALDQFEADDIIGCLNHKLLKQYPQATVDILTSDRDLYQLISPRTQVLVPRSGTSDLMVMNEAELMHIWKVKPQNVPDLKGLMGDSSDNLSGVSGIGEKTAIDLISKYHNLENIYKHLDDLKSGLRTKLEKGKTAAFFTREMATLDIDCPVKELKLGNFELNLAALKPFLERYEMKTILRRLGLDVDLEKSLKRLKVEQPKIKKILIKLIDHWEKEWEALENTIYVEGFAPKGKQAKIIGISIFNEKGLFYWDWKWVDKQLTLFENPTLKKIDPHFNNFLQSAKARKNTYDLKRTLALLKEAGYQVNAQSFDYDMMLTAYALNPEVEANFANHAHLINQTEKILSDEAFFGSGIKHNLQPKNKADFISHKAVVISQTKPKFLAELEATQMKK